MIDKRLEDYIVKLNDEIRQIQLLASLKTLKQVDLVIDFHNKHELISDAEIIINIFGLLQSLFVAVDSLYNLAITITNSKSYININQNKSLNNLKHIRNDIVGHPINRKYGSEGIGYSVIENENLKPNTFTYYTYIKKGNDIEKSEMDIDLNVLKSEYLKEKNIILNRLKDYVLNNRDKVSLINDLNVFYNNSSEANYLKIKELFNKTYGNLENTRFVWRLDLIAVLLNDETLNLDIKNYLLKVQTIKLMEIASDLERKSLRKPYLSLPKQIIKVYRFLDQNPIYINYLKDLHDPNSPYFLSDLNYLLDNIENINVRELLLIIKNSESSEMIYLIGSIFKNYKSK